MAKITRIAICNVDCCNDSCSGDLVALDYICPGCEGCEDRYTLCDIINPHPFISRVYQSHINSKSPTE